MLLSVIGRCVDVILCRLCKYNVLLIVGCVAVMHTIACCVFVVSCVLIGCVVIRDVSVTRVDVMLYVFVRCVVGKTVCLCASCRRSCRRSKQEVQNGLFVSEEGRHTQRPWCCSYR